MKFKDKSNVEYETAPMKTDNAASSIFRLYTEFDVLEPRIKRMQVKFREKNRPGGSRRSDGNRSALGAADPARPRRFGHRRRFLARNLSTWAT